MTIKHGLDKTFLPDELGIESNQPTGCSRPNPSSQKSGVELPVEGEPSRTAKPLSHVESGIPPRFDGI